MHTCAYCQREFARSDAVTRHLKTCKSKTEKLLVDHYESQLQTQREHYESQLQTQRDHYESQLQTQREHYESQLQAQREHYEKETAMLKEQLSEFKNQIFEIAKQPKHQTNNNNNNQRIVNVVNQLAPYDLTPELVEQIVEEHFTQEAFEKGPNELAKLVVDKILTDPDTQKRKVVCTDISRRVFRYLDALEQEPQLDLGFQKTHGMIKPSLTRMNVEIVQELERRGYSTIRYPFKTNHDFIWDENRFADKVINYLK